MASSTIPQSDDVALAEIRDFAYELGTTPGRNQLMDRFGWGASRSTRLLKLYKEQPGPDGADYPGPADQPEETPDRTEADRKETDRSPADASPQGRSGPQHTPDQSPTPVRSEQSEGQYTQASEKQSGPVRSEGGPDGGTRSGPGADRRSAQVTPQTAPAPVRPTSPPVQAVGGAVATPARSGPPPSSPPTGPLPQAGPVTTTRTDRQTTPDQTTTRTDSPAGRKETDQTTDRTGGPDRQPYGLVAATLVISLSAFTAVWGGWVGLGRMVGFGPVNLLPGIGGGLVVDLAITLPLGIEAYAAAALWVAVGGLVTGRGRWFAGLSAGTALLLGAFGQATYHLLEVQGQHVAPDWVIVFVSVLPVIVLGAAGVLLHLVLEERKHRR